MGTVDGIEGLMVFRHIDFQPMSVPFNSPVIFGLYDNNIEPTGVTSVLYIFLFLHIIMLPIAIAASIIAGLYPLAIVDGVVFLLLFIVWWVLRKKR